LQLNVQQVWSLEAARCRFGKYLRVAVNGRPPDIRRLVSEHPPQRENTEQGELIRGLAVRLLLRRDGEQISASAELLLGEEARFYPSDAAMAGWMAQADQGKAVIVYE
jgi:DNA polymerase-3 subunit alpha